MSTYSIYHMSCLSVNIVALHEKQAVLMFCHVSVICVLDKITFEWHMLTRLLVVIA